VTASRQVRAVVIDVSQEVGILFRSNNCRKGPTGLAYRDLALTTLTLAVNVWPLITERHACYQ
jgi:hypothetical protein